MAERSPANHLVDKRSSRIVLFLFTALLCLPWIGERRFYTRGEPREALVPLKMVETSNWILPRTFDDRVPSKPPFTHWMMGLSAWARSQVTGTVVIDEWASRLPAAIFSLVFLMLFFEFLALRVGTERALHGSLILLTSLEWLRGMVSTRVDTVLSVLLGLGLVSSYSFAERRRVFPLILAILSFAAATLTKGPVAVVLPGALIGGFLLLEKRRLLPAVQIGFQVFLPALILAGYWYYLAWQIGGDDFFNKFWYENVERFASSTDDKPHAHSVFYLFLMLVVGLLPWSLVAFSPIGRFLKPAQRIARFKSWWAGIAPLERYSLIVVVGFFLFFSIPSSKRGVYLLPASPFAAILLSRITVASVGTTFSRVVRIAALSTSVLVALLLLAIAVSGQITVANDAIVQLLANERAHLFTRGISWSLYLLIGYFAISIIRINPASRLLFINATLLFCSVLALFQGPIVTGFAETVSEYQLSQELRGVPLDQPLYSYEFEYYGTMFYLNRTVSLTGWKDAPSGIILVKERDYPRFTGEFGTGGSQKVIGRSTGSVVKLGDHVLIVEFTRSPG